jgi:hypothetical protein
MFDRMQLQRWDLLLSCVPLVIASFEEQDLMARNRQSCC